MDSTYNVLYSYMEAGERLQSCIAEADRYEIEEAIVYLVNK